MRSTVRKDGGGGGGGVCVCGGVGRKQIEMGRIVECKERRWKKSGSKSVDGEEVVVVVVVCECVSVEEGGRVNGSIISQTPFLSS